jgi:hypothetical protein
MAEQKNTKRGKGAPIGNEFYKLVKMPTGRPRKYTPGQLWKQAQEYFAWVSKNPLKEMKAFSNGKTRLLPKMRAMTETAFCLFAGIDENTWQRYKSKEEYKEYWAVSGYISRIIYTQKFEGSAADMLNANIIARDLGLTDRKSLDIDFDQMTDEQLDMIIDRLKNSSR